MGLAALDPIHAINASSLFLTPGFQLRTRGRLFAFAGARALVFAIPVSGSGGEWVQDEEGREGHRTSGGLGGGPWVRAGVGLALADGTRAPTLTVAGGSIGLGGDAHPWAGASAGVSVRGRWRVEAEVGYDRNWVEDSFTGPDPTNPQNPFRPAYVRRSEEWYRTMQIGVRYVP
jgi:hypothetical protein